MKDTSEVIWGH